MCLHKCLMKNCDPIGSSSGFKFFGGELEVWNIPLPIAPKSLPSTFLKAHQARNLSWKQISTDFLYQAICQRILSGFLFRLTVVSKKNNCLISSVQFLSFKTSKKKNWRTALEAKDKVRGVVHQNQPSGPKRPISRNVNDWSMEKPGETPCVKLHLRLSSTKWHFFEVEDFNLSPWSFQIVTFCDAMNSPARRSGNIRNSNKTKSLDVAYIVAIQPLHNKSHSLPWFLMCKTQEEADRAAP